MLCYSMSCYFLLQYVVLCYVTVCYVMPCHVITYHVTVVLLSYSMLYMSCHVMSQSFMLCYCMLCLATLCFVMSRYVKVCHLFHESGSIPTLPLPINSDAADGNYLDWQGEQGGTWSPLICPVEALIPLLCEAAGAPGRSSSLATAWWQSSLLAFEVGVDLKGPSSGFLEAWQ